MLQVFLASAAAALVLMVTYPAAAEQRVATTGTDSSDCSLVPCATLSQALSNAVSGDEVKVGAGKYNRQDSSELEVTTGVYTVTISGGWTDDFATQDPALETVLQRSSGLVLKVTVAGTATAIVNIDRITFKRNSSSAISSPPSPGASTLELNITNSRFHRQKFGAVSISGGDGDSVSVNVGNSEFFGNRAPNRSGAITLRGESSTQSLSIQDSSFVRNRSSPLGSIPGGGAISVEADRLATNAVDITIRRTVFARNRSAREVPGGGALAIYSGGFTTLNCEIEDVEFHRNKASGQYLDGPATGGAIRLSRLASFSNPGDGSGPAQQFSIRNSFFSRNAAKGQGGAVHLHNETALNPTTLVLENVSITENRAQSGGGLEVSSNAPDAVEVTVSNSVLWGNRAKNGSDMAITGTPLATISDSDFEFTSGSFTDGGGNLSLDPLFVDVPKGDLHLTPASPLRDMGTCVLASDIDGDPRPTGGACDIGADEFSP